MTTTPTNRFFEAVKLLDENGYPHFAMAAIEYYDRCTVGMNTAQRKGVADMFDEVLTKELSTTDNIHPTEILLSPDFVFLKALARTLVDLELNGEDVVLELTDEDLAEAA